MAMEGVEGPDIWAGHHPHSTGRGFRYAAAYFFFVRVYLFFFTTEEAVQAACEMTSFLQQSRLDKKKKNP